MINGLNHSKGTFSSNSGDWNEMLSSALRLNKLHCPLVELGISFQHQSAFDMEKKN
jgi:hypothetical protein